MSQDDPADEWLAAEFAGVAALPVPLTWGQSTLWTALHRPGLDQSMVSLRRVLPLPAPSDVDSALTAIGALLGRHSSLRTRLVATGGTPEQIVAAHGAQPVLLVRADPGDEGVAARVANRLSIDPVEHGREWPQRIAVVVAGGAVREVVVVFSHTTVDFLSARIVLRDLRLLFLGVPVAAPAGLQSADIAALEGSGTHARRARRAVAHCVRGYARLPQQTLPVLGPALTPRFGRTAMVSTAADAATRLLAARHGVSTATVLLAAIAAVASAWSGNPVVGIFTMVSNRFLDGYQDAIAKLNQLALTVVDLGDRPDFAALLPRVWRAALDAYQHAYHDPELMRAAFEAAGFPYATGVSPHCYVNDFRLATDADLTGRAVDEAEVRAAMDATTVTSAPGYEHFAWLTRVEIVDAPGGVRMILTADTSVLPPQAAERFLRGIERLLVDAAYRDVPWPFTV
ncbi:hypothetical protein F4553_000557 [Allocatelliglobosispora scoriae]|uniref:Condensation domain-containing protein n=1 Tax=Allocatelliglobosispora scoriae TaxID=643052 RepID=A0A841BIM7_9ACTN|nr:condensation domain-containing protein [Allocatelliglobosispora scoriae]MBB5867178.1 hypothetical protein [Allocatelliglobosispora scoriae]